MLSRLFNFFGIEFTPKSTFDLIHKKELTSPQNLEYSNYFRQKKF